MSVEDTELALTHAAGWVFRCHRCDITTANLDGQTGRQVFEEHQHGAGPLKFMTMRELVECTMREDTPTSAELRRRVSLLAGELDVLGAYRTPAKVEQLRHLVFGEPRQVSR